MFNHNLWSHLNAFAAGAVLIALIAEPSLYLSVLFTINVFSVFYFQNEAKK